MIGNMTNNVFICAMKAVFKIILIYLAIQLPVTLIIGVIPFVRLLHFDYQESILPVLCSILVIDSLTLIYLWKAGYIGKERHTWSFVSVGWLAFAVLITFPAIFLSDCLLSHLTWLPDIMEQEFERIQSYWFGIILITLIGPVFEEILFRGAITKLLLKQYAPPKAIVISALLFGIIHGNPVQIIGAGLIGLLLAWTYYKTASLIPCIIIHVINNSTSVFLTKTYPEADYLKDIMPKSVYYILLALFLALLIGAYWGLKKQSSPVTWKQE
jgi:membrane protease YdiL (CAAX protease family)